MSLFDIFIWKCSCGYIELWEEFADVCDDSRRYFTKACIKCEKMMIRTKSLREYLSEENK